MVADGFGRGSVGEDEEGVCEEGDEVARAVGAGRVKRAACAFALGAADGEMVRGRSGRCHVVLLST